MRKGGFQSGRDSRSANRDDDADEIAPRPRFGQGQFRREEAGPTKHDPRAAVAGRSSFVERSSNNNDERTGLGKQEQSGQGGREPEPSAFQVRRGGNLSYVKQVPKFLQRLTQKTEAEEDAEHAAKRKELMSRLEAQGVDGDMPVVEDYYGLLRDDERQVQIQAVQKQLLNDERSERGLGPAKTLSPSEQAGAVVRTLDVREKDKDKDKDEDEEDEKEPPFVNGKPVYRKQKRKEGDAEKASTSTKKHLAQMPKREPSKGKLSFSLDGGGDDDGDG